MKSNKLLYRNRGLEYLHSMKDIFHAKWADTKHGTKITEFYQYFRAPSITINEYSTNFRRQLRELKYNGVSISPDAAAKRYIIGLGSEFIPIRNQGTLPVEFSTNNLVQLEKAARMNT